MASSILVADSASNAWLAFVASRCRAIQLHSSVHHHRPPKTHGNSCTSSSCIPFRVGDVYPKVRVLQYTRSRLSIALINGNGIVFWQCYGLLAQAAGREYRPGADVPGFEAC